MGDFSALHHYLLVWMAIMTSPKGGLQLDLWLSAMAAMDVVPLAAAFATVWSNGEECFLIHNVQARAKEFMLSSVTRVPFGQMGCLLLAAQVHGQQ